MAWVFVLALIGIQLVSSFRSMNQTVFHGNIQATPSNRGQAMLALPIEIPGNIGNVEVSARSPVSNDWVELNISLVNDATQESEDLLLPIEYYFGSDSDGPWSEGSQSNSAVMSSVPGGSYHLLVEPDASAFTNNRSINVELSIVRDVTIWSSFWAALLMLIAYPLLAMKRSRSFETRRWANSDYAPAMYRRG
jgi:hypothetical protein